jgi:hypothetical protein
MFGPFLQGKRPAAQFIAAESENYYPGMKVGQAFQPDSPAKSGWKARPT